MERTAALTLLALGLALQTNIAGAASITNVAGTVYENAMVTLVEPDGITIRHSSGVAKLLYTELPEGVRAQYGFDAGKAAAYGQQVQQAKADAARQAQLARDAAEMVKEEYDVKLRIQRVFEDGTMLAYGTYEVEVESTVQKAKQVPDETRLRGPGMRLPTKTVAYQETNVQKRSHSLSSIVVAGLPDRFADGDTYADKIYRAGRVQVGPSPRSYIVPQMLRCYAVSRELAMQLVVADGMQVAILAIVYGPEPAKYWVACGDAFRWEAVEG